MGKLYKCILWGGFIFLFTGNAAAQTVRNIADSTVPKNLPELTIVGKGSKSDYQQLPEIVGTNIYAGKKNALIVLDNVKGNIAMNTMRQVLAKIPGIHVWESDPSGIQIGIAARGLSPNRSWEFNVRQNGYDISADPFGYPEAYYNPQLHAVQRIEVVRGQGSLQYGPQFGGLVNYILRNGSDIENPVQMETNQTFGSNALYSSYNAVGGKSGKIHYYAFFNNRNGDGWRHNSRFSSRAGFGTLTYAHSSRLSITAEVMQQHTLSQQPGGLSDSLVLADAQSSLRGRNWFDLNWTTPALTVNYTISNKFRWTTKFFATIGNRKSVGFISSILISDSINAVTKDYNHRTLHTDLYRNYGMESRIISDYVIAGKNQTISAGIRIYTGNTNRLAEGKGTTGIDYDMTVIENYVRDINFRSHNAAFFAENIFRIGKKILLIPGIRYEWLEGSASGRNGYDAAGNAVMLQQIKRSRNFLLAGIGAEYHFTTTTEFYANISQAYRPIQFANLQAPPTTDLIDPALTDAVGYNADLGYRGKIRDFLQFDFSAFHLQYNNRVGTVTVTDSGSSYRLITNVGNSSSTGFEGFFELDVLKALKKKTSVLLSLFASYGYTYASYSENHKDVQTKGKKVENAPLSILRTGLSSGMHNFQVTLQFNYTGSSFSDANNTLLPSANGQAGLIPSFSVIDISGSYKINKLIELKSGINNLFDKRYFTRRAGGYPGPGALPADGRTFFISLNAKI